MAVQGLNTERVVVVKRKWLREFIAEIKVRGEIIGSTAYERRGPLLLKGKGVRGRWWSNADVAARASG